MGGVRKNRVISLREPIGVALETLRAHKLRSFLMLLGIILSVSTLIRNLGDSAFNRPLRNLICCALSSPEIYNTVEPSVSPDFSGFPCATRAAFNTRELYCAQVNVNSG